MDRIFLRIYYSRKHFSDILFCFSILIVTFANVNIFYVYLKSATYRV